MDWSQGLRSFGLALIGSQNPQLAAQISQNWQAQAFRQQQLKAAAETAQRTAEHRKQVEANQAAAAGATAEHRTAVLEATKNKPVSVGRGSKLVNPSTGELIAEGAPAAQKWITGGHGEKWLVDEDGTVVRKEKVPTAPVRPSGFEEKIKAMEGMGIPRSEAIRNLVSGLKGPSSTDYQQALKVVIKEFFPPGMFGQVNKLDPVTQKKYGAAVRRFMAAQKQGLDPFECVQAAIPDFAPEPIEGRSLEAPQTEPSNRVSGTIAPPGAESKLKGQPPGRYEVDGQEVRWDGTKVIQ